jgi:HTH-type transcriptional regulator/antitoxin HigA
MDSDTNKFVPAVVPHPGDVVAEYLEFHGWTQRDLSRRTGLTPKTISELCNGKTPVTPTTSLLLEKTFQRPASIWLNLQRQYDEALARRSEASRSKGWLDWAKKFPLKEMRKWKLLPSTESTEVDVDELLSFLGVSSPENWNAVWKASRVALRQSEHYAKSPEAIAVWIRATELAAQELRVADYNEQTLRNSLDRLRALSRQPVDEVIEPVQKLCGEAGVAVVWIPEMRKTAISGCARWLTDRRALIGLSLRYKSDDQMWFTLFHEIGHLLLHRKRDAFIIDTGEVYSDERTVDPEMMQLEEEASRFAADTLIPPRRLSEFIAKATLTNDAIHDFSAAIGIGPGIVVGRLQFEGLLKPFQGNALKQRINFAIGEES